jgi:superfamily II DNA or RNA helicase
MSDVPFVIDNQSHRMSEVLSQLLQQYQGRSLDVTTAYFNIGGWHLLREGLRELGSFRLLLGDEPEVGTDIGMREAGAKPVKGLIRELSEASFSEQTLRMVEELVAFLMEDRVQVRLYTQSFLHAKSYLFYGDKGFTRIAPQVAIVGSSNFTRAGLLSNRELNLMHRTNFIPSEVDAERVKGIMEEEEREILEETAEHQRTIAANVPGLLALDELTGWFRQQWREARDFKEELIELINASKFGRKEYTPYQVYTKAIFEYFRDEIDAENERSTTRSAVELSEFQEDAVKKARKILARYDGVMIADSVGLGKTWIGKKLLEEYAYHRRYKAAVICPAALQKTWRDELLGAGIAASLITQEALGRDEFDSDNVQDVDIILIDESHNFRNRNTQRYDNLERLLAANNRSGGVSKERKKLILLTATPINNDIFDLYNQVNLFTSGDRSFFAAAGIGDLQRYFLAARRLDQQQESGIALFNLLEEVVVRRTRPFIKKAYPDATIKGQPIHWPERKLKTVRYNLENTYQGIYTGIVERIETLRLAPYRLETYKKHGVARDQFEEGREEALVGIFKSRYLKRFESCIEAFRISVRRALEFLQTFESFIQEGKVLDSSSFQKAMRYLASEDEEDDVSALPNTLAESLKAHKEARRFLETLPALNAQHYNLQRLRGDLRKDIAALQDIWQSIMTITPMQDAKLVRLKELLAGELRGQKVLIFTYYRDTARYLYKHLGDTDPETVAWRTSAGDPHIRRMDSGADAKERARLVAAFAPRANHREEIAGTKDEISILISTDVLSEGQNLQDCGVLINYDLHWNPTRMIQRAGRIDRIGTTFDILWILNMFPDDGLERLLGLVASLTQKIAAIDRSGLLDASILGEVAHPQNFNTLHRIEEEDGSVVEEQEQFVELASSEFLLQQLKELFNRGMRQELEELPDGIHSGLLRDKAKGVFFSFVAEKRRERQTKNDRAGRRERTHYWRYIDLSEGIQSAHVEENRYIITNLIQCLPETARFVPESDEVNIFELQERAIASILQSSLQESVIGDIPKILDPMQQTLQTVLQRYMNTPYVNRQEVIAALQKVNVPQPRVHIKTLRKAYQVFSADGNVQALIDTINTIGVPVGSSSDAQQEEKAILKREDLKLICFEYIWW